MLLATYSTLASETKRGEDRPVQTAPALEKESEADERWTIALQKRGDRKSGGTRGNCSGSGLNDSG